MSRCSKYFLQLILWLVEDGFCRYYVQDGIWNHQEMLDVASVTYFNEEDAQDMLSACFRHDPYFTLPQPRGFQAEDC